MKWEGSRGGGRTEEEWGGIREEGWEGVREEGGQRRSGGELGRREDRGGVGGS